MPTIFQVFRFSRPPRLTTGLIHKSSTDALSVILVWQALRPDRTQEVLSLEDDEFVVARLGFRAEDAAAAAIDLDEQCTAHDIARALVHMPDPRP